MKQTGYFKNVIRKVREFSIISTPATGLKRAM
jgi:hypothetical protein